MSPCDRLVGFRRTAQLSNWTAQQSGKNNIEEEGTMFLRNVWNELPSDTAYSIMPPACVLAYEKVACRNWSTIHCNEQTKRLLHFSPGCILGNATSLCFVWISEQTAIIFLYSVNWLVCITETIFFSQSYRASWYYQSFLFTNRCTRELLQKEC
jgi:hypothetical protein